MDICFHDGDFPFSSKNRISSYNPFSRAQSPQGNNLGSSGSLCLFDTGLSSHHTCCYVMKDFKDVILKTISILLETIHFMPSLMRLVSLCSLNNIIAGICYNVSLAVKRIYGQ